MLFESRCSAVRIFRLGDHFSWQVLRETSCFGGPKSRCHDRCKGSERFDVDVQISWQVRSDFVAGAVKRDFWICGSLSEIGGSLERKLRFGILMLSLEKLLLQRES